MMPPVIVFTTASDIEASVVMALLDSHGIDSFRASGNTAGDLADGGQRARADPHRRRPDDARTRRGGSSTAIARTSARAWCRCATSSRRWRQRIGYRFRDRGLLEHALTHKSRAAEDASGGVADNESLEFLGDAVLGLVVADALFHQYPNSTEGEKSKIKASVVSTQSLARHAERMGLGEHLILGRGEEKTGGRFKQALLADAYEALIAAIYLDGGLEAAGAFLRRELKEALDAGDDAAVRARLQVGAAGAAAGARPAAARVPRLGRRRAGSPQDVQRRGGRRRRGARRGDRQGEEGGRAGGRPAGARPARCAGRPGGRGRGGQRAGDRDRGRCLRAFGEDGFARLVRAFYAQVPADDVLGPMYPRDDLEGAEQRLRDFLVGRFGGPPRYIEQRGHPRLRMRHMPFTVDERARDRWVLLMEPGAGSGGAAAGCDGDCCASSSGRRRRSWNR